MTRPVPPDLDAFEHAAFELAAPLRCPPADVLLPALEGTLALPLRVGRAYDNDFILDDEYAAAHHAVIEPGPDGALVMRDLGTRNGLNHGRKRVQQLTLDGDTVVRMGHTSLRVRAADFPVPAELRDRTMHGWEGLLPGTVGVLLAGLVALFVTWLLDAEPF